MAKTDTVKYEEVLRAYLSALRTDHLSRGAIEFPGFAASTADQVANLVAAARAVDKLRLTGLVTFESGQAHRAFDDLWDAIAALDREAQP